MSYILEALKKAQAERQLGSAPSIHTPPPASSGDAARGHERRRLPLAVAVAAIVVVAGAGAVAWHRWTPPAAPPAIVAAAGTAPAAAPVVAAPAPQAPVVAPPAASGAATTLAVKAPDAPPTPPHASDARHAAPAPAATRPAAQEAASARAAAPAPASAPPAARQPGAPAANADDGLPLLQQLPESVQGQIPRVAFGGYMYSANPADRLLLVDKTLRREGEEVAPGLVLEKLLPRAAVMNFRGTRYRVGL